MLPIMGNPWIPHSNLITSPGLPMTMKFFIVGIGVTATVLFAALLPRLLISMALADPAEVVTVWFASWKSNFMVPPLGAVSDGGVKAKFLTVKVSGDAA